MTDFYLKAADEQALQEVLAPLGMYAAATADCPAHYVSNARWAVDVVGTIYMPTGNTITNGDHMYAEMVPIPGFHANIRTLDSSLDAIIMALPIVISKPNQPSRVWA